jgi:2-polyprenyl-3-methyl-5-hydroxy-6-metoxy-1,4-benzoquinol methylase
LKNPINPITKQTETWNQRFDREEYIFGKEPNEYLASHTGLLSPGQRALVVADGEGRNSVWCAQRGLKVDAFDLSPVAVEKARKLAREFGVHVNYAVANIANLDWPEAIYDVVVVIFIQFAPPSLRERIFTNCIRTLKPGGILILQGYSPKQLEYKTGGPPILEHLYTEAMLREAFSSMEIIECRFYEAEIHEGIHHAGMSALAGLVARKL